MGLLDDLDRGLLDLIFPQNDALNEKTIIWFDSRVRLDCPNQAH